MKTLMNTFQRKCFYNGKNNEKRELFNWCASCFILCHKGLGMMIQLICVSQLHVGGDFPFGMTFKTYPCPSDRRRHVYV